MEKRCQKIECAPKPLLDKCAILRHARGYLDALSRGIDPLTGEMLDPGEVVCQDRIRRCLVYVSDVLGQVIENDGEIGARRERRSKRLPFAPNEAMQTGVEISDTPVSLNTIVVQINAYVERGMYKLRHRDVAAWLAANGILQATTDENGKKRMRVTETGKAMGITEELRYSRGRGMHYTVLLYSAQMQRFIVGHLPEIAAAIEKRTETENTEP